jgi:hypothetical protein
MLAAAVLQSYQSGGACSLVQCGERRRERW